MTYVKFILKLEQLRNTVVGKSFLKRFLLVLFVCGSSNSSFISNKTIMTAPKLHSELQKILSEVRKSRNFNASLWIDRKCKMFNDYMTRCGLKGCVVNLSGGVDSAVTLGLMKRASQLPGSTIKKVIAISQPIHSSSWAFNRADECAKNMNVEMITIDQTFIYDELKGLIDNQVGIKGNAFAGGQLRYNIYIHTHCHPI